MNEPRAQRFPKLYPILDAELALPPTVSDRHARLRAIVLELAEAGVEILQYRNKRDPDPVVLEDAAVIREAAGPGMRLILNDRAALVNVCRWHGVHIGQQDLSPREARSLTGEAALLGLSTHNETQTRLADREPVDYIAIGPVFSTASKADPDPVIGLDGVRRARALTHKPLIAIGGITRQTARSVIDAGADSLAVIGAIFAPGVRPAQAARDFLDIFK